MIGFLEQLMDSWRWWAAMGAGLGAIPVAKWIANFVRLRGNVPHFSPKTRFILAVALLSGLVATFSAGAVIPWATDGRLSWLNPSTPAFRVVMAMAWLCWGFLAWSVAIAFARNPWRMLAASFAWWAAVFVAADMTMGAGL